MSKFVVEAGYSGCLAEDIYVIEGHENAVDSALYHVPEEYEDSARAALEDFDSMDGFSVWEEPGEYKTYRVMIYDFDENEHGELESD